jgi:FtsH-binding integral membrane protein
VASFDTAAGAFGRARTRTLFGQVMGLVAITCIFAAAGAWIGRDLHGLSVIVPWIAAIAAIVGLNVASARGNRQLAVTLLFAVGLLLGISIGYVVHFYALTDPSAVYQAAAATGLFVAALGAFGYATRRDLSGLYRALFWALLGLIAFGLVGIFVRIPAHNTIYAVIGLVVFGGYTVVDFNRLRRAGQDEAVPLAAGIFLDVFNIFLLFLQLFGGRR